MTKLEESIKASKVFVLDVQAPEGAACDNEMHVFSNQEACQKVFVEIYGDRILECPCLMSSLDWDEEEEECGDYDDDDSLGYGKEDPVVKEQVEQREEQMRNEALLAYGKAFGNIGGHTVKGYTFRVLQRNIVEEAGELF